MPEPAPIIVVADLDAAIDSMLTLTEGSAVEARDGSWARITIPNGRAIELVTAAEPTEADHAVSAEATGNSIAVRFTSAVDASGLKIPRRVFLTAGADLAEQVDSLLRDQPAGLRRQVLAAAIGVTQ